MMSKRKVTFREHEINYILSKVKAGDSCSVVGVGSVGKSNLLRHLRQLDTQAYHLKDAARGLHMVMIDPNNMLDSIQLMDGTTSAWAGYEIIMHRLYKAFYPFEGFSDEQIREFTWGYQQLRDGKNPLLAHIGLRYLEVGLENLFYGNVPDAPERRITFILDEFEEMLESLPVKFFQTLRGIRDDYKYKITFITLTRRALPQIIVDRGYDHQALEPFVELFTDSTLYLGPYSKTDATDMLDALSSRRDVTYSPSFRGFLLRSSGGHAGLLRAAFSLASQIAFGTPESEALAFLISSQAIQAECQTIWESLTEQECQLLKAVTQSTGVSGSNSAVKLLMDKQLLTSIDDRVEINPPLFREYVRRYAE